MNSEQANASFAFVEGERMIEMPVLEDSASYYHSEGEGESDMELDEEVKINNKSQRQPEPEGFTEMKENLPENKEGEILKKTPREEINEIDKVMQKKMRELQVLMNEGGLTRAAGILNDIIKAQAPRADRINESAGQGRRILDYEQLNKNENASKPRNKSGDSDKSVKTIYEPAVPSKRNSSSSEEGLVNTSDEFDNACDDLTHLEKLIAGER